jgi:hypothetical protein
MSLQNLKLRQKRFHFICKFERRREEREREGGEGEGRERERQKDRRKIDR